MSTAAKSKLREEIEQLRNIGAQMANVCFNLGQNARHDSLGRLVTGSDLVSMYELSKNWDAIKRQERNRREPK